MSEVPLWGNRNSSVGSIRSPLGGSHHAIVLEGVSAYMGTLLIRKQHPTGPYSRPMPRAL